MGRPALREVAEPRFDAPVVLSGRFVRLVPLELAHVPELAKAGADPDIWTYMRTGTPNGEGGMRAIVEFLLDEQRHGRALPFTQQLVAGGALVGMTRYLDIARSDASVEIGGTWLTPHLRRTPVNTESKRLLLGHAFDVEKVHRVQLKTDLLNLRSQRAIERLGAQREGVLREHLRVPDGRMRSSVYYSILDFEWPTVRDRLDALLARPWSPPDSDGT